MLDRRGNDRVPREAGLELGSGTFLSTPEALVHCRVQKTSKESRSHPPLSSRWKQAICSIGAIVSSAALIISYARGTMPLSSQDAYPYPSLRPRIQALVARFGSSRLLWGSDFPFVADGQCG